MDLIEGIGGVFLFSNQPKELAAWYREILGINCSESPDCSSFYFPYVSRDLTDSSIKRTTTWAILPAAVEISGQPRTGQINYRVRSMNDTIAHLQSKAVAVDKTQECEYGKFAWITDLDGNKIELFEEPAESIQDEQVP